MNLAVSWTSGKKGNEILYGRIIDVLLGDFKVGYRRAEGRELVFVIAEGKNRDTLLMGPILHSFPNAILRMDFNKRVIPF